MSEANASRGSQTDPQKLKDLQDDAQAIFAALNTVFVVYDRRMHLSTHNYDQIKNLIQKHE